ncbi:MAG: hypothetical protein ACKVQS_05215 [Fimbriimonadaceae bacterium]
MSDHDVIDDRPLDVLEEMGYETTDEAASSPVGKYTIWLFGFIIFAIVFSAAFFTVADRVDGFKFKQERKARQMPPEGTPLLQGNIAAHEDMYALRKEEHAKLNSYAKNKEDGTYKVPIDKAMHIVVERGLPTRPNAGVPEDYK